jgi:homoserine dehydrogenase
VSGRDVIELDSSLLNSPVAVAGAVHDLYLRLREGRRVLARVCGARSEQAMGWLGYALEQAGVPYQSAATPATDETGSSPEAALQLEFAGEPSNVAPRRVDAPAAPLGIVLLGLGTVGLGVYRHLAARPDLFDVRRVVVRDTARHRGDGVSVERLSTNLWQAINEPADLVIELIGGVEPAGDVVHAALLRGRTVISANKALLATRWDTFERYTRAPLPGLRFSAAVGGSLPVLETVRRIAADAQITRVRAVLNGTCNFVIDEVACGATFARAVALAQASGFAEADPSIDLSGTDALQKLSLIARTAFGAVPTATRTECRGIEHVTPAVIAEAQARGSGVRLVATCTNREGVLRAQVRPEELAATDFLTGARHEANRVEIDTADGETWRLAGKGAGRWPSALAVMADVYDVLEAGAVHDRDSRAVGAALSSRISRSACPSSVQSGPGTSRRTYSRRPW